MAPKPLEVDQPEKRGEAPATKPGRVGFGLEGLTAYLRRPRDAEGAHLTPGEVSLILEDGLLMALGPDGDPVTPRSFAAIAALRPDDEIACPGGERVPARRVAAALEAQAASHHREEISSQPWLLAMLGMGPQPDAAPEAWLRAEQLRCEITAIGDELLVSLPAGHAFLVTGAKGEAHADDDRGHLRIEGRIGSAAALADRVRAHLLSRGEGPAEMALADCGLILRDRALVVRTPFADVELIEGAGDDDGLAVRIFLADGRPIRPGALTAALGHPTTAGQSCQEATALFATASSMEAAVDSISPEREACDPSPGLAGAPVHIDGAATRATIPERAPIRLTIEPPRPPGAAATTVVVLAGLPPGVTPSAGVADGAGRWLLQAEDYGDLTLTLPGDGPLAFTFEVTAIAVLDREGSLASAREIVAIATGRAPIPLNLSTCVSDEAPRLDAVLLRDLPTGARLSAGTEDPGIRGWIVRRAQLPGLAMIPAAGRRNATRVSVLGISLGANGQAEARELTRLAVIAG